MLLAYRVKGGGGMNIIDRIKNLHALAERNSSTGRGGNRRSENPRTFKHNLELEEIINAGTEEKQPHVRFDYLMPETTRADVGWKRTLFGGIAKANFCRSIRLSRA
jgi:hypothetical protein